MFKLQPSKPRESVKVPTEKSSKQIELRYLHVQERVAVINEVLGRVSEFVSVSNVPANIAQMFVDVFVNNHFSISQWSVIKNHIYKLIRRDVMQNIPLGDEKTFNHFITLFFDDCNEFYQLTNSKSSNIFEDYNKYVLITHKK